MSEWLINSCAYGLYANSKELELVQKLSSQKSPLAPLRLLNNNSAEIGGGIHQWNIEYCADVLQSIPQDLFSATSRATYSETFHSYTSRAEALIKDRESDGGIIKDLNQLCSTIENNGGTTDASAKSPSTLKLQGALREFVGSCNTRYKEILSMKDEVFNSIMHELGSLRGVTKDLETRYSSMKNSGRGSRALQTDGYYKALLDLSKITGVDVPLDGICDQDIPAKVNLQMPGAKILDVLRKAELSTTKEKDKVDQGVEPSAQKPLLSYFENGSSVKEAALDLLNVEKLGTSLESSSQNIKSANPGVASGSKHSGNFSGSDLEALTKENLSQAKGNTGRLGALVNLYNRIIPGQQARMHKVCLEVKKELFPDLKVLDSGESEKEKRIFGDLKDNVLAPVHGINISEVRDRLREKVSSIIDPIFELKRTSEKEKNIREELLKIQQSEREKLVKFSPEDYIARVTEITKLWSILTKICEIKNKMDQSLINVL